jgi:hypothetical protein
MRAFELLIKAGADIEALDGSIGGGTPLGNPVGTANGRWLAGWSSVAPGPNCGTRQHWA